MSAAGLRRARLAWMVFAAILLIPTAASWPVYYALLHRICDTCPITPELAQGLSTLGWSVDQWAAWKLLWPMLITLGWAGMGLLIFARRSDDYGALLISAVLVTLAAGFGGVPLDVQAAGPVWSYVAKVTNFGSGPGFFALIALFPNGRFAPRWAIWLLLYAILVFAPNSFFPDSALAFGNWPRWVNGLFVFIPLLGSLIVLPVYRYWRVSNPAERQQTKWAVLGFIAAFAGIAITIMVSSPYIRVEHPPPETVLRADIIQGLGYGLGPLLIPIFIGIAVLRSRLWDIDVIIRRTLVYSVLTGLLALAYLGSILVLQNVFQTLTGRGQDQLVTVISTLGIALLFGPLRARVQAFIDRRFYRQKYDSARILAQFAASARDDVDLTDLQSRLMGVVDATLQPKSVDVWLRPALTGWSLQTPDLAARTESRQT